MKIKFLGASGTVTGSSYVLTSSSGQSILIDLGMFQGPPEIDKLNYLPYDFDCKRLTGAILTHAHLDHCGRLPILLPRGFAGHIWMTPPTRDLTELSLLDSAKIAHDDHREILFDKDLAQQTIDRFTTTEYRTPTTIGDFTVTFRDAGHILGSASLEIVIEDQKIIFSGDLGNSPEDLLQETETLDSASVVVIESTYGDKQHPKKDAVLKLQSEINEIETSGGTLLVPAFALDRTQELLHMLMHLKQAGKVRKDTPVFLDSPMAQAATQIYTNYPKIFNDHIQAELEKDSPFSFPGLEVVEKNKESQAIYERPGPKVIIAGSGMMTGGRIVGHAVHYLPIPTTRLFIVGYQGEGTLGRYLLDGEKKFIQDRQAVVVRGTISSTQSMSSHADQDQLMSWLSNIKGVKKVFITHGEDTPRNVLKQKIATDLNITDVTLPVLNQEIML